jgi:sigma-B regulation protein RsbU (phosphoserine phosphatase)
LEVSIADLSLDLIEKICVVVLFAYIITRTKYFTQVLDHQLDGKNCAFLILVFGAFSVFGTYSGIELPSGAIANIRDLGPMIAGLVGGPIVGLGAGLIGGVHRYFLGGLTCIPCALSTVIAGLAGGMINKWRKGEFVGLPGAVLFAFLMECFHMGLALLIARPFAEALEVVKLASFPMILANTIGMAIFALILTNLIKERKTATERDRYRRELERRAYEMEIAGGIQQSFLPESPPQIEGVELAALNSPAREVGGDFYDFIPVSQDKWGLVIADVSGKGVPAALFMALSRTLVRANAVGNPTASQAIRRANDLIVEDDRANMFVTLFYTVLDPTSKTLTYVNAGHNPPLMLRREGRDIVLLEAKGIALGVMPNIELEEREISLRKGDLVVLYTDGVTEAMNSGEEQFGQRRLVQLVEEGRNLPAQELITRIQQGVAAFSTGQPQSDDITIMVLRVAWDEKQPV